MPLVKKSGAPKLPGTSSASSKRLFGRRPMPSTARPGIDLRTDAQRRHFERAPNHGRPKVFAASPQTMRPRRRRPRMPLGQLRQMVFFDRLAGFLDAKFRLAAPLQPRPAVSLAQSKDGAFAELVPWPRPRAVVPTTASPRAMGSVSR